MKKTLYWKRRIYQCEINITGIIVNGLVHHSPKRTVLLMIKKEIMDINRAIHLTQEEIDQIWDAAKKEYELLSKKTFSELRKIDKQFGKKSDYEKALKLRKDATYRATKDHVIRNNFMTKIRNRIAYSYEKRFKRQYLDDLIGENAAKSPFFLCSTHKNPAKDHADWEGKMYFDENWENQDWTDADRARIEAYIRNHSLKSIQWVTGEPVYLITRPNCKHFMISVPIEDVMKSSVKALLRRKKLFMKDEIPATPELLAYRRYYERHKIETDLYELIGGDELQKDMESSRRLMEKYARLVNEQKKTRSS